VHFSSVSSIGNGGTYGFLSGGGISSDTGGLDNPALAAGSRVFGVTPMYVPATMPTNSSKKILKTPNKRLVIL